ncbi:MAG: hypothetical protein LBS30_04865 [Planctomycetota bacterium]|jgi:hypothetical protein|nr:hypothetical protein [Planctomycetota bacterium]
MDINSIARMPNFDVTKFLSNGKSEAAEKSPASESRYTPVNTPFSAPNWGRIPTKSEPKMSDEEFENAIRELARKEASRGILAGTDEKSRLRRDYISVVSPDRKAMYDESMAKTGGKMNSAYSFFDALGNKSFHYNKQTGMWFHQSTAAEKARADRFLDIYTQAFSEYEAEHGEVVGTPQVKHFNAYG